MVRTDDAYIPDYRSPSSTVNITSMVAIRMWKCICCDARFGYLNYNQVELNPDNPVNPLNQL